jgi:hypothetical protein
MFPQVRLPPPILIVEPVMFPPAVELAVRVEVVKTLLVKPLTFVMLKLPPSRFAVKGLNTPEAGIGGLRFV